MRRELATRVDRLAGGLACATVDLAAPPCPECNPPGRMFVRVVDGVDRCGTCGRSLTGPALTPDFTEPTS